MTTPVDRTTGDGFKKPREAAPVKTVEPASHSVPGHGMGSHRWMMIICCVPMLSIAVVLVAIGVVSSGFLFAAIMCTLMMAAMHAGMGGRGHD